MYKLIVTRENDATLEINSDNFEALKKVAQRYNKLGCDVAIYETIKVYEVKTNAIQR